MSDAEITPVVNAIKADRHRWVDFMMRFELGLEAPVPGRARRSALTIALSYIIGGMIPLLSYILISDIHTALYTSVAITLAALFVFGYVKGRFTGLNPLKGALQTVFIGGLAAGAAFLIARLIS
jgi:predicted membrane protein (TIGR00267 family)